MKIEVRQEHIDRGCRYKASCCPVYHALKAAGLPVKYVDRTVPEVHVKFKGVGILTFEDPYTSKAIARYDATGTMTPFTFELDLDHVVYPK
jgi:hypothetical protein